MVRHQINPKSNYTTKALPTTTHQHHYLIIPILSETSAQGVYPRNTVVAIMCPFSQKCQLGGQYPTLQDSSTKHRTVEQDNRNNQAQQDRLHKGDHTFLFSATKIIKIGQRWQKGKAKHLQTFEVCIHLGWNFVTLMSCGFCLCHTSTGWTSWQDLAKICWKQALAKILQDEAKSC